MVFASLLKSELDIQTVSIRGLKIKNLLPKIKTSSSSPIKPNQGFIDEKNSEFFSGRFYGKSLANHAKTAKKTTQKGSKNTRFMTYFFRANLSTKVRANAGSNDFGLWTPTILDRVAPAPPGCGHN